MKKTLKSLLLRLGLLKPQQVWQISRSWKDATHKSVGYADSNIVRKKLNAANAILEGKAAFERDTVLFDEIEYSWPLLSGLLLAAALEKSQLRVLDFGGSFGSTYRQNKKFLALLDNIDWNVVEQEQIVRTAKSELFDNSIDFYFSIDECIAEKCPNVAIFSSVLQYLEHPSDYLRFVCDSKIPVVIIDRTPMSFTDIDEVYIQRVPKNIYDGSYPCWFFSETKLVKDFEAMGYSLIESFTAIDGSVDVGIFKGMIFVDLERYKNHAVTSSE